MVQHSDGNTPKEQNVPVPSENMPRFGNRLTRRIGMLLLRLFGWKLEGRVPNENKLIIAASPHTSNWDFVLAMMIVVALGVKISFLMKKEAFFWPFESLFKALGGIPLDRSASEDTVAQIVSQYQSREALWVAITPEGTRAKVDRWKTGFLRVAQTARVPVLLVAWDYPSKRIVVDGFWQTTGNHEHDAESIRKYINSKYVGRHAKKQ